MLAGMLLGLAASASWALANVVVQRAGRAVGALPGLFWTQVVGDRPGVRRRGGARRRGRRR